MTLGPSPAWAWLSGASTHSAQAPLYGSQTQQGVGSGFLLVFLISLASPHNFLLDPSLTVPHPILHLPIGPTFHLDGSCLEGLYSDVCLSQASACVAWFRPHGFSQSLSRQELITRHLCDLLLASMVPAAYLPSQASRCHHGVLTGWTWLFL